MNLQAYARLRHRGGSAREAGSALKTGLPQGSLAFFNIFKIGFLVI